jgi:hypothetical protein
VVKINRPFTGAFGVLLLFLTLWGGWFSITGYLAFFKLSDVIVFSWKVGVMLFITPILFYFTYVAFYATVNNKPVKINNNLANYFVVLAFLGAVFSLVFSLYLSNNLNCHGYTVCQKGSWMDPNKYVKDIMLCSQ